MLKIIHLLSDSQLEGETRCRRVIDSKQITDKLEKATCKICLHSIPRETKLKLCTGCEDNFYNGNNDLGVKECWNLERAEIVRKKKIGMNDTPPWKDQPVVTILSCRHERGYVFVGSEQKC